MGSQRVGHDLVTKQKQQPLYSTEILIKQTILPLYGINVQWHEVSSHCCATIMIIHL